MQPAIILLHSSDATGAACTTARRASQCRAPACLIWSTNTWTPRSDEPPPRNAARAFSFQPAARRAIAAASNPPIASSTRSRRASLVSGVGARTPTRCTSTRNLALMHWSDHLGEVTTGLLRRAERREERRPEQWEELWPLPRRRRGWRTGLPSVLAPRIRGEAVGCGRMGLGLERTGSVWYFHAARQH